MYNSGLNREINMKYKLRKVFDCNDMPQSVRYALSENSHLYNGSFISFDVYKNEDYSEQPFDLEVNSWLLENGAEVSDIVVIHYWW